MVAVNPTLSAASSPMPIPIPMPMGDMKANTQMYMMNRVSLVPAETWQGGGRIHACGTKILLPIQIHGDLSGQ